ncbi:MAG: WYL domain-containing protein [Thermofilaceae archaeon]
MTIDKKTFLSNILKLALNEEDGRISEFNLEDLLKSMKISKRSFFRLKKTLPEKILTCNRKEETYSVSVEAYKEVLREYNSCLFDFTKECELIKVVRKFLGALGSEAEEILMAIIIQLLVNNKSLENVEKTKNNLENEIDKLLHISNFPVYQNDCIKGQFLNILRIIQAIDKRKIIKVKYAENSENERDYELEPQKIFYTNGEWYLWSRDRNTESKLVLSLRKIISVTLTTKNFYCMQKDEEKEFSDVRLEESFGPFPDTERKKVVIKVGPQKRDVFLQKKWTKEQSITPQEDGSIIVTFRVRGINQLKEWLFTFIPHIEIIEPQELAESFKKDIQDAYLKISNSSKL